MKFPNFLKPVLRPFIPEPVLAWRRRRIVAKQSQPDEPIVFKPEYRSRPGEEPVPQLSWEARPSVRDAIADLGRTEDVRFSPNGERLAIAGFLTDRVLVLAVSIQGEGADRQILLSDDLGLGSSAIREPHGLSFLDDGTFVVGSRAGDVALFEVPTERRGTVDLDPITRIRGNPFRRPFAPGSVAAYREGDQYRILACNNFTGVVTSYTTTPGRRVRYQGPLLEAGLDVPDGVAVSPDARWIAVSNHAGGTVPIFENTPSLSRRTPPAAILVGLDCPHGLLFAPDGRNLLVADAGRPFVYVATRDPHGWKGEIEPTRAVRVVTDDLFRRARYGPDGDMYFPLEGGPKGVDINPATGVVVTTTEQEPLAFFDLGGFVDGV